MNRSVRRSRISSAALVCGIALALAGCATSPASGLRAVAELKPGIPTGYLPAGEVPDSMALVPPRPADDSAAFAHNQAANRALGWAWALILAEIAPERADALFARGRSYGESRLVCNVHCQSDILQGRFMGLAD